MRRGMLPCLAIGLAALGGCAPMGVRQEAPMVWVKSGASSADLAIDRNACVYDAHKAAPYAAPNSLPVLNLAIECLESKAGGWRRLAIEPREIA